jgi:hypothetical protein
MFSLVFGTYSKVQKTDGTPFNNVKNPSVRNYGENPSKKIVSESPAAILIQESIELFNATLKRV